MDKRHKTAAEIGSKTPESTEAPEATTPAEASVTAEAITNTAATPTATRNIPNINLEVKMQIEKLKIFYIKSNFL